MADLQIFPDLGPEAFARLLADNGRPAPWVAGEDGEIHAANRQCVLVVDPNSEQSDGCVLAIAEAVAQAVNNCAGLTRRRPGNA
ncbi:hypothetical protein [Phenylobacterium sp.]|jgi:hypothetical protein|uniref:hypothetical protein n=1 Tax=Phenylobacterium sp. TaxID=1871053 RepID=UPI0037C7C93B